MEKRQICSMLEDSKNYENYKAWEEDGGSVYNLK